MRNVSRNSRRFETLVTLFRKFRLPCCRVTYLPRTRKAASSSRKTAGRGSSKNTKTRRAKSHAKRSTATRRVTTRKASGHRTANGATYVFECTRQGCGYRIVREENAEVGQLRSDLKCPKCHNNEFKCLGKGDLPDTLELAIPATTIDFDSIRPVDLGSN